MIGFTVIDSSTCMLSYEGSAVAFAFESGAAPDVHDPGVEDVPGVLRPHSAAEVAVVGKGTSALGIFLAGSNVDGGNGQQKHRNDHGSGKQMKRNGTMGKELKVVAFRFQLCTLCG